MRQGAGADDPARTVNAAPRTGGAAQAAGDIAEAAFEAIVERMEVGSNGSASPAASAEVDEVAYTPSALLEPDDAAAHSIVSFV